MFDIVAKIGVSGCAGALMGLLVVWWVEPTTSQGATLLIVISVMLAITIHGLISKFAGSNNDSAVRAATNAPRDGPQPLGTGQPSQAETCDPPDANAPSERLNSVGPGR